MESKIIVVLICFIAAIVMADQGEAEEKREIWDAITRANNLRYSAYRNPEMSETLNMADAFDLNGAAIKGIRLCVNVARNTGLRYRVDTRWSFKSLEIDSISTDTAWVTTVEDLFAPIVKAQTGEIVNGGWCSVIAHQKYLLRRVNGRWVVAENCVLGISFPPSTIGGL